MLVKFISSETGELIMFADVARQLLEVLGKACSARGTFTRAEMEPAAERLREAVHRGEQPAPPQADDDDDSDTRPVALGRRAWPLIDMLERTARGDARANIVWEAAQDF